MALQNHCVIFRALYSELQNSFFFDFCAELVFRNGGKSGSVMYTSEQVRKKCWQRYQSAYVEPCSQELQHKSELCTKIRKSCQLSKGVLHCLLSVKTRNTKFPLFYDCRTYENIFRLFDDSANKTKAFNLKVNCKELKLVFVHHVNTKWT